MLPECAVCEGLEIEPCVGVSGQDGRVPVGAGGEDEFGVWEVCWKRG